MHSTRLASALALAAALAPVVPAWAATFSSPLLTVPGGGGLGRCTVSNVGTAPVNLTGTLYDVSGNVKAPLGNECVDVYAGVLPAGVSCNIIVGSGTVRCVIDASPSKVRAVLVVTNGAGDITASEPATKK